MSASLVGSEMCIRDRSCAALLRERPLLGVMTGHREGQEEERAARHPARACLLYTSDAADDM
eukprot:11785521-Alexandrium_andersonii.AAC.1